MITVLEEAMDYAEGIKSVIEMTRDTYEGIPALTGVMYLLEKNMQMLVDLLAIVKAGNDMKEAPETLADESEAKEIISTSKNITYHEMMTNQFDESEGLNEIPETEGTLDALDAVIETVPKPKLTGKKGKAFRLWRDKGAGPIENRGRVQR